MLAQATPAPCRQLADDRIWAPGAPELHIYTHGFNHQHGWHGDKPGQEGEPRFYPEDYTKPLEKLGFHNLVFNTCELQPDLSATEAMYDRWRGYRPPAPAACVAVKARLTVLTSAGVQEGPQVTRGLVCLLPAAPLCAQSADSSQCREDFRYIVQVPNKLASVSRMKTTAGAPFRCGSRPPLACCELR